MIQFEHVTQRYEGSKKDVFHDFSVQIKEGELILLTGVSGVGKSTFIRMLLKDTEIVSGSILVQGRDIGSIPPREVPLYRRKLGVVFQECHLIEERSAYKNVELARLIAGGKKKDSRRAISSLFSLLDITELYGRYPRELSGGEKQKICLARALINYPPILLADEPTGNLSPGESKELMRLLGLVNRQGTTVVVATNDKGSAEGLPYREIALKKQEAEDGQDAGFESAGQ